MQFINTLLLATSALAPIVAATRTITFVNQDSTQRTIYFTPTSGCSDVDSITVAGGATVVSDSLPESWIGNWYSVSEGAENTPGMLGEVSYDSYSGLTFFDVSAIVNPDDTEGVQELYPSGSNTPVSGCTTWPCDNAYYLPDDVQTKSTSETDLICTLGSTSSKRMVRSARFSHMYVEKKM